MKKYQEYKPRKPIDCWACDKSIEVGMVAVYIGKKINKQFATSKYFKPEGGKLTTVAVHKECFKLEVK